VRKEFRLRAFNNKVLKRTFGPKKDEVTGEWRRLYNKELYALYSSTDIIQVIKSIRLRWAGQVARMGKRRGAYRVLVRKPRQGDHFEDPRIDEKTILKWMEGHEMD
jgi:hypothetical protein